MSWSYEIVANKENENISNSSEDNIQKIRISNSGKNEHFRKKAITFWRVFSLFMEF